MIFWGSAVVVSGIAVICFAYPVQGSCGTRTPQKSRIARLIPPYYILKAAAQRDAANFVVSVAVGSSKAAVTALKCDVRCTPESGRNPDIGDDRELPAEPLKAERQRRFE